MGAGFNVFISLWLGILPATLFAQHRFGVNGYLTGTGQGVHNPDTAQNTRFNSQMVINNRLNLTYHYGPSFSAVAGCRNMLHVGGLVTDNVYMADIFSNDIGYFDLNFNWIEQPDWFVTTQIDRLYLSFTQGPFEASVGRIRLNWARTLVWNPNDIFNTYSYYDIDYTERPGTDALKLCYYNGPSASTEAVVKLDSANKVTTAMQYKTNQWGYDFQAIAGYAYGSDLVAGVGWEGQLWKMGFRGEATYYYPVNNMADTTGVFLMSAGLDYQFAKGIFLQTECLYNHPNSLLPITSAGSVFGAPPNAKSLSFAEYNLFASVLWPVNPITNITLASMVYSRYKGWFVMPGIDIVATNNIMVGCFYQHFSFKPSGSRLVLGYGMVRVKWSF
jgi:hypothetical protein